MKKRWQRYKTIIHLNVLIKHCYTGNFSIFLFWKRLSKRLIYDNGKYFYLKMAYNQCDASFASEQIDVWLYRKLLKISESIRWHLLLFG